MKEEKRSEIIQDALNFLDDEMIEDVEKLRGCIEKEEFEQSSDAKNQKIVQGKGAKRKKSWRRWTALAASLCVLIAGTWIYENYVTPSENLSDKTAHFQEGTIEEISGTSDFAGLFDTESWKDSERTEDVAEEGLKQETDIEDGIDVSHASLYEMSSGACQQVELESAENLRAGVTIPKMEVSLKKNDELAGDMIGFFIHEGRCYVQYEYVRSGADFVGNYVRTINGLIDEWTPEEGYVDGAGSLTGNVYEVKGVNPEFMLCMIWDDGVVETYINNNGITLRKGSDLVDDRLHLKDNVKNISFQTDEEWNETLDDPKLLSEEYDALFEKFLDSFAENDFAYVEGKSYYPFGGDLDNSHIYHLYFTTENGLVVRFSLMGDGYVCFPWINGVCVQIDQDIYDEVVDVLKQNLE